MGRFQHWTSCDCCSLPTRVIQSCPIFSGDVVGARTSALQAAADGLGACDDLPTTFCLSGEQAYSDHIDVCREEGGAFHIYSVVTTSDEGVLSKYNFHECWESEDVSS
jgi:hypothetical protein